MTFEDRKQQYLFERHSVDEVRAWNRRLRFFRYFRAFGGHANDSDSLDVAISYNGEADLLAVLEAVGIHPRRFTETPPQPKTGVSYPSEEFEKFPSIVEGTRWIEQPGHTEIFGTPVFVWCHKDRIMISPRNDSWDIDESTILAAESVEPHIAEMRDRIIDPPRDTDHYLCGAKHPILRSEQDVHGNTH
jgi:hypothetical protein